MLVVYTGGTFGMFDNGQGLEAATDLETDLAEMVQIAQVATGVHPWRYVALGEVIDSADADLDHALAIAALLREGAAQARGMVVVHGTDTLAYVASVSAFALRDLSIPIVFTGAQRSFRETGTDATSNFLAAYEAASDGQAGVRIAFGGAILPAVRAVKRSSDEDAAFVDYRSASRRTLGVSTAHTHVPAASTTRSIDRDSVRPSVGLLRVFPGFSAELLRAAIRLYPDGLVLECYGAGTAPMSSPGMYETVVDAVNARTPIVIVTQCQTGAVQLGRYAVGAKLHQAGAWSGGDLTAEAALAKLGVLAANDLDWEQRRLTFAENLVGERIGR